MIDEILLAKMADMLSIASDQTRLRILLCLLGDNISLDEFHKLKEQGQGTIERSVNDISMITGSSQSLTSHQLKILKDAGLVQARRDGRQIFYSLSDRHVVELVEVVYEHVSEE